MAGAEATRTMSTAMLSGNGQAAASEPGTNGRHRGTPEKLAKGLGWFSIGLGLPQVLAPGRVNRLIGVEDSRRNRAVMRAMGVRELAGAPGILDRPRPSGFLFARVAGDILDLSLLGASLRARRNARARVTAATAAVAGVTVLDVIASARTSRAADPATNDGAVRASAAITVNRPPDEVYRLWRDVEGLPRFMAHLESVRAEADGRSHWVVRAPAGTTVEWDAEVTEDVPDQVLAWRSLDGADVPNAGTVRLAPAPGGRGTEVRVELEYRPPGGALGAGAARLFGEEPVQQLKDDLRRFKQVVETGDVVRSEGSPDGTRTQRQLHQRDARPLA